MVDTSRFKRNDQLRQEQMKGQMMRVGRKVGSIIDEYIKFFSSFVLSTMKAIQMNFAGIARESISPPLPFAIPASMEFATDVY